jgi:hypothetical protein
LLKELPWKARGWPTDHISVREHDQWFRAWALRRALIGRAANATELLPASFTGRNAKRHQDQRAKVDATITQVLGSYNLRARVLAGRGHRQEVHKTISDYIAGVRKKTEETYEKNDWYFRDNSRRFAEALLAWPDSAGPIITALADLGEKVLSQSAPHLWLDLARLTLRQPATIGLGWELLERAATFWESRPFAASERWPNLLRCAEIAERLDPTQAQGYYRRSLKSAEGISDADFDDVLGLNVATRSGQLVVDATSHFVARGRREIVYVSSALVSPKPAPALLRAFQIIDEPSDYGLPHEAGPIDQRNVNIPGFQLHPWIFDRSADRGTQDHDPASKHLSTYFHRPTEPLIRYFKLTASTPTAWADPHGKPVLEEEIWDDGVSEDEHYNAVSSGRLVWCSLAHIRSVLRAAGRSLLLKITIERRHNRDQQEIRDKKHECRKARLYLYTAEGRLLTVDSSRQIG